MRLECGHIFGDACIQEWLSSASTCPMCRAAVGHLCVCGGETKITFEKFLETHNLSVRSAIGADDINQGGLKYFAAANVEWIEKTGSVEGSG